MNFDAVVVSESVRQLAIDVAARSPYVLIGLAVLCAAYFAARGVRVLLVGFAVRTRRRHNVGLVLGRIGYAMTVFAGLLVAAMIALPGFEPGQLVNLLGISSVAFGFAFRDILQNFLAGILLLIAEPFRINDQIRSGDFEGTVEDIQTRATFIRTYDGRRIVIPNSALFVNPVTVNTAFDKRRLEQDFTFPVDADVESRKRLLLDALEGVDDVLDDPAPDAVITDMTESVIKIRLRWWIAPPSQYELRNGLDAVLARVAAALARERADSKREAEQALYAGFEAAAGGRGNGNR